MMKAFLFLCVSFFDQYATDAFQNLELLARQVVEGFIIGLHKSPFHGFSVEFAEHRQYNQGEPVQHIDWKVYARTDRMFVKKYEEETNLRCQIVVDTSSSMYFPDEKLHNGLVLNKLKFSALGAAVLMNLLRKQRDAFGLSLFEDDLNLHSHCKSSTVHYRLMLNYLEKAIEADRLNKTSSTADALHKIADAVHRRSLVIIFSDMFDMTGEKEELFSALQHLKYNKHEVLLFHVLDKRLEAEFDFANRPYRFVDMETGEEVKLQSNVLKENYIKHFENMKNTLREKCLQYKIDLQETDIHEGYHNVLTSFLVRRKKMIH